VHLPIKGQKWKCDYGWKGASFTFDDSLVEMLDSLPKKTQKEKKNQINITQKSDGIVTELNVRLAMWNTPKKVLGVCVFLCLLVW
jgi:hypothetical protein